jgi:hypothetical protein
MGYTSAEGLILTGQGSTNDVTIKNDADADVLTIPTGTTAALFAGNLRMTKGGDISSASPLVIDTDGTYFDVTGTTNFAAMTVAAGNYFMLQFDGALTITHGSGIELPGAADLTTAAGDRLICYATAANTVEVMNVATEAAPSAGGAWTYLSSVTASASDTVDFDNVYDGTYDHYMIVATNVLIANGGGNLEMQVGTGSTPTYISDSVYAYITYNSSATNSGYSARSSTTEDNMNISQNLGNAETGVSFSFIVQIYEPDQTTYYHGHTWSGVNYGEGSISFQIVGSGTYEATTAVTSTRFMANSLAVTAGTFRLYGLAKS